MYWCRKGHHFLIDVDQLISDLSLIEPEFRAAQAAINKARQNKKGGQAKPDTAGCSSAKMKDSDRIPKKSKKTVTGLIPRVPPSVSIVSARNVQVLAWFEGHPQHK